MTKNPSITAVAITVPPFTALDFIGRIPITLDIIPTDGGLGHDGTGVAAAGMEDGMADTDTASEVTAAGDDGRSRVYLNKSL